MPTKPLSKAEIEKAIAAIDEAVKKGFEFGTNTLSAFSEAGRRVTDEPVNLDERRKRRQEDRERVEQWQCSECRFAIWHCYSTSQVVCANCETEATNLVCAEVT